MEGSGGSSTWSTANLLYKELLFLLDPIAPHCITLPFIPAGARICSVTDSKSPDSLFSVVLRIVTPFLFHIFSSLLVRKKWSVTTPIPGATRCHRRETFSVQFIAQVKLAHSPTVTETDSGCSSIQPAQTREIDCSAQCNHH